MDLHYLVNPTMEPLEREFFLPSLPDGFHVVRHPVEIETSGNFMQDGYLDIMRSRTRAICQEIEKHPDGGLMVWSDVDVVFLSDSVPDRIEQAMVGFDLLFQKESGSAEDDRCNFGFQVIRRSETTLCFYRALLVFQEENPLEDDQSPGNTLLNTRQAPRWGHLPLSFAAESNGGVSGESVFYHANMTLADSQEQKRQLLVRALEVAQDAQDNGCPLQESDRPMAEPDHGGEALTSLMATLREFLERDDEEEFLWLIDDAVWGQGQLLEDFMESFESCRADLLATDVRARFEDMAWPWWGGLTAPGGTVVARGEHVMAAFLALARISRRAARVVLEGVDSGWRGHHEVLIPTLIGQGGMGIEDIGGAGSFTPPERAGRWYDGRTWHWQGPVEHVPGKLHFPVPYQNRPLSVGRLADDGSGPDASRPLRLLYVSPVGAGAAELLPPVLDSFLEAGAECLLLQYDETDQELPEGVRTIRDKGYKFPLAIRHLHPEVVAEYDYIFFWDDDLGVKDFDPQRFARIMRANRLDMAQPAIQSPHGLSHAITQHRPCPPPWRDPDGKTDYPVVGRLTNFVEIMAPVYSREAWREFYGYLDPENRSGWGYDYIPLGRKGIVDAMPVVHTRAVQSINRTSEAEIRSFLDNQGLFRHGLIEMGWLFE